MSKSKEIDWELISKMSVDQKQQAYYTLAKRANQRFRDIHKKGEDSHAIRKAQEWLKDVYKRDTFKQSTKLVGVDLDEGLTVLEKFYTSTTSTMQGIKENKKKHKQAFLDKGIDIKDEKSFENVINTLGDNKLRALLQSKQFNKEKSFYDFISSNQFKMLSSYADSNQVVEDFNRAMDEGFTIDFILDEYREFLNSEMTFEQLEERRQKLLTNNTILLH